MVAIFIKPVKVENMIEHGIFEDIWRCNFPAL